MKNVDIESFFPNTSNIFSPEGIFVNQ